MDKYRLNFYYKITIVFLSLFLLCSCATSHKETGSAAISKEKTKQLNTRIQRIAQRKPFGLRRSNANKTLTGDVLVFLDLKQVDLDNDAQKDIIALYTNTEQLLSVKVIRVKDTGGEVVYKEVIGKKHVKIDVKEDIPLIIIKEAPFVFGNQVLRWNGETFEKQKNPNFSGFL